MRFPYWTPGLLGVRWVDHFRKTDSLELWPELMESQWKSPAELRQDQWSAFLKLLSHATAQVPYYRRIFRERGLHLRDFQSPEDLHRLPILTKEIIREEGKGMLAENFPDWQARPKATSGSTGVSLHFFLDRLSHGHQWASIWRAWSLAGFRPGDRWAMLSGGALVPGRSNFRQRGYTWLNGAIQLPSYRLNDLEFSRFHSILQNNPLSLLYAYPSNLRLFARWLQERGHKLPLKACITTSELLLPQWRKEIEEGSGVPVFDTYGSNDGGLIAFECEEKQGHHLNMEGNLLEVLDSDEQASPEGETGKVVSTNLLNYTLPFIRYELGDRASLNQSPCACGRGLDRVASVEGRMRDFIQTPEGAYLHGTLFNQLLLPIDWIEIYQVVQKERERLTLRLVTSRKPSGMEEAQLIESIQNSLDSSIRIEIERVEEIKRSSAGKYRMVLSHLDD